MPVLRLLLTVLMAIVAAVAGIFAALVGTALGATMLLRRRLRGAPSLHPRPAGAVRPRRASGGDAIDITATEVPAERRD